MFEVSKRWSERWFPWLEDNSWGFEACVDSKEQAEHYIEVYSRPVYEYKIEDMDVN